MKPWVMFGTHALFGDYADAIHSRGDVLSRIVINMPEPPRPPGQSFEDRLARYHAWADAAGLNHRVEVISLEGFQPRAGESYMLGFRGPRLLPLRDRLVAEHGLTFEPLVHATAHVSPMSVLREGVFVGAGAVIGANSEVGEFTLINRRALVGHDTVLGPCNIIGPGSGVAGFVTTESGVILGINATVIDGLHLGAGCYVAAGAVVLKDVPSATLVAGVPAVEKKKLAVS